MAYQGEQELRDAIESTYDAISALGDPEATSVLATCLDKMTTVQSKLAQTGSMVQTAGGQGQQGGPAAADPRAALMAQLGGGGGY